MTDLQLLTIAIAIILPICSLIYSNSRITDVRDSLNKRIDDFQANVNLRFDEVDRRFDEFDRRLENQNGLLGAIMGKLDELDRRTLRP
jgi:hypothetical protein